MSGMAHFFLPGWPLPVHDGSIPTDGRPAYRKREEKNLYLTRLPRWWAWLGWACSMARSSLPLLAYCFSFFPSTPLMGYPYEWNPYK